MAQVADSDFVLIQPGTFEMGDASIPNARVHTVTLTHSFLMQKTPLTQSQWIAVMGSNPSHFKECGLTCPVEMLDYEDVQLFITELNRRSPGKKYRLPTEAEWEYAARAGTAGDYGTPGGITLGGWTVINSGGTTHPVGLLQPNAWGLFDMEGNVWEWVNDWYGPYPSTPSTDPAGPASGSYRVLRGGSCLSTAASARSAYRINFRDPGLRSLNFGFRLAKTP